MQYIFDTNTFLQAKNDYYPFDVCPAFWDWLDLEHSRGTICSIDAVKAEMKDKDARAWVANHPAFFETNDLTRLADIANYVSGLTQYLPAEHQRFFKGADPILIAHALNTGGIVVTQEVADYTGKMIKIPDICKVFGVTCLRTSEVLRALSGKFILEVQP
jgi:hypothetical protein